MSKLLISEPPLQVLPTLAKEIGLSEAITLQQLHYLLQNPHTEVIDDEKWVKKSYDEWGEVFPFWSTSTIKRNFSDLEKRGLVVSCQPETSDWNQRKAYKIDYESLDRLNLTHSGGSNWPPLNRNEKKEKEIVPKLPKGAPLDWKLALGVSSEQIAEENAEFEREKELLDAYERAMGYGKPLNWYGDDKFFDLRKFLSTKSVEDIQTFGNWSNSKYSPFNPVKAKNNPDDVITFWDLAFREQKETEKGGNWL